MLWWKYDKKFPGAHPSGVQLSIEKPDRMENMKHIRETRIQMTEMVSENSYPEKAFLEDLFKSNWKQSCRLLS